MNGNYEQLPAVLNAGQLAETLGISRAGAYQLLHQVSFPTLRIGKRMLVPKDKLIVWIDKHSGGDGLGQQKTGRSQSVCGSRQGTADVKGFRHQYNRGLRRKQD